jgi:hypothetical protein
MTELTIYSLAVCEMFQFFNLVESSTFFVEYAVSQFV